jgi:glycosyltransferase involved in cell wall biosynthesis
MRQNRVLILGPSLVAVGGVTTHLNQLFDSDLSEKFELIHFQVGSEGRRENTLQRVARIALSPFIFFISLIRYRPEIVHFNTSLDAKSFWRDVIYLLIARALNRKIVFQKHGGPLPQEFFAGYPLLASLLKSVLKYTDVIILLGFEEEKSYKQFLPDSRIEVIPNAIDARALTSEPLSNDKHAPLRLIYLGRLARNKGVFEILDAFASLIKQGRDLRLTIGGIGSEGVHLRERAKNLGLGSQVVFAGMVSGEIKDKLWRESQVFVFPTYHREGLPYSLLEAMAAGAVPIITPIGAIPDVMQDEVHGVFVKGKDSSGLARAIAMLDDDRLKLARMSEAGRKRVLENYTVGHLVDSLSSVYFSLMTSIQRE